MLVNAGGLLCMMWEAYMILLLNRKFDDAEAKGGGGRGQETKWACWAAHDRSRQQMPSWQQQQYNVRDTAGTERLHTDIHYVFPRE